MTISNGKKHLLGALWFGISGYVAAMLGIGIPIYLQDKSYILACLHPFTIITTLVALSLGGMYGNRIINCAYENNLIKALTYGFWGGMMTLLIVDLGIILLTILVASSFKEFWNVTFQVIAYGLTAHGWVVIPVGMISAWLLCKLIK